MNKEENRRSRIQLLSEWQRITGEHYYEMLAALTPEKWESIPGGEMFRLREHENESHARHYAQYKGEFFSAIKVVTDNYTAYIAELENTFLKNSDSK